MKYNNSWMTPGIRISCKCKRYLYLLTKNSNDGSLKNHYKQYCKILATVIREAKRCMYNNQLTNSTNKIKTTWNIIKAETNRLKGPSNTDTSSSQNSPEDYNRHFLSISKSIIDGIRSKNNQSSNTTKNPTNYLSNIFHTPFPCIKFRTTSTREIEKIINSLKSKDSFGYDEISTKILKISAPFISSPLRYICNKSI